MNTLTHADYNQWRDTVLNAIHETDYQEHPDNIAHDIMSESHDAMRRGDGLALAGAYAKAFDLIRCADSPQLAWAAWHAGKVPMYFDYEWRKIEDWIKRKGMQVESNYPNPSRFYTLFRGGRLRGMSWTDDQRKAEYYAKWRYRQGENLMLHKMEIKESQILAKRSYSESWTKVNGRVRHTEITEFIVSTALCRQARKSDFIENPTLKDHAINIMQRFNNLTKNKGIEHPSQLALRILKEENYYGVE